MELARLASKQQAAASSSKQAAASKQPCRALSGPQSNKCPEIEKKCYHAIWDGFPQLSREQLLFRSDPQVVAKGGLLGFWPVPGRGHWDKFRTRVGNRKTQFPGARGTFGGEIRVPQKFLPEIAQLFYILRFGRPDPHGRKIAKYCISGTFGLGQPLALREIPGRTGKNTNSLIETEKR